MVQFKIWDDVQRLLRQRPRRFILFADRFSLVRPIR